MFGGPSLPESLAANRPSQPLRTYTLTSKHKLTGRDARNFGFQENGQTVLWINKDSQPFQSTVTTLHEQAVNGPVAAAFKSASWPKGIKVHLGKPTEIGWKRVEMDVVKKPKRAVYGFEVDEVGYRWRMTHNKGLGVNSAGDLALELVDVSNQDMVLAAFAADKKDGKYAENAGKVVFYVELAKELEALALATVLGVVDFRRKSSGGHRSGGAAAASAAGGASGGAGGGC